MGHGTAEWFQIGKGVHQGCILSPGLFNLYEEHIMRNSELDEAQAGIKIAERNINNFRYAEDITLMEESEEELKSLLMKVKEESENNPIKKWAKDLNRHFSKKDLQMGNNHMKRCPIPLLIREMKIKTIMRYHFMSVRWLRSKSLQAINAGEGGCGEKGTLLHCWWECKVVQPLREQCGDSFKNWK